MFGNPWSRSVLPDMSKINSKLLKDDILTAVHKLYRLGVICKTCKIKNRNIELQ